MSGLEREKCVDCGGEGWISFELRLDDRGNPIFGYEPESILRVERTETRKRECLCQVPATAMKQVRREDGGTFEEVTFCLLCGKGSHPDALHCRGCGRVRGLLDRGIVPEPTPWEPPPRVPTARVPRSPPEGLDRFSPGDRVKHTSDLKGKRTGTVMGKTERRVVIEWDGSPGSVGYVIPLSLTKLPSETPEGDEQCEASQ